MPTDDSTSTGNKINEAPRHTKIQAPVAYSPEEQMAWILEYIADPAWQARFRDMVRGLVKPRPGFEEQMLKRISGDGYARPFDLKMVSGDCILQHFQTHATLRTSKSKPLQILADLDEVEARKYRHCFIPGCEGHFWRAESRATYREQMRLHL